MDCTGVCRRLVVELARARNGLPHPSAVYRTTDTSLGRQVAIKVLPGAFAADPRPPGAIRARGEDARGRNHPHIAAIYAVEKSAGIHALVMELVEGPTLEELVAGSGRSALGSGNAQRDSGSGQGPKSKVQGLLVDEALPIAKQIAEALEAAHEQGIIHWDLKPAKSKVWPDRTVKVLAYCLLVEIWMTMADGISHGRQARSSAVALRGASRPDSSPGRGLPPRGRVRPRGR